MIFASRVPHRVNYSQPETVPLIDLHEDLDGLYSYALVLSRNGTEAEDLVQEACLRALRARERLRPDSNVKSWLFTTLRNIPVSISAKGSNRTGERHLHCSLFFTLICGLASKDNVPL